MANFARIIDNVAVDVSSDPQSSFHAEIAAQFVPVPDNVRPGWVYSGGTWEAPPAPPTAPAAPLPNLTPVAYYNAFTVAEAVAIKNSTDPVVQEIWFRLAMLLNNASTANEPLIDPSSVPVVSGLTYLSTTSTQPASNPAGPYIHPARIAQIQAGIAQ